MFCSLAGGDGQRVFSSVGTTPYWAPEVYRQSGYTAAVDSWALGVCAHVLLTGAMPPFVTSPDGRGVDPAAQLDAMMREGGPEIDMSGGLAPDGAAADLLRGMFQPAPHRRLRVDLPAPGNGTSIKRHPFFLRHLSSWSELERRELTPPFVPMVSKADDDVSGARVGSDGRGRRGNSRGGGALHESASAAFAAASEDTPTPFKGDFEAMCRLQRTGHTRNLVDAAVL